MRIIGSYVGIILTILLACAVVRVLSFYKNDSVPEIGVFSVQPVSALSLSWSAGRFEATGHACGGHNESWITGYQAYNGIPLSKRGQFFSSESEAGIELRRHLQYANRITEVKPKYDEQGIAIGERVIAFFAKDDDKDAVSIIWTEGKSLFVIKALSLDIALEFEKGDSIEKGRIAKDK